jgi:hypothetical protein
MTGTAVNVGVFVTVGEEVDVELGVSVAVKVVVGVAVNVGAGGSGVSLAVAVGGMVVFVREGVTSCTAQPLMIIEQPNRMIKTHFSLISDSSK